MELPLDRRQEKLVSITDDRATKIQSAFLRFKRKDIMRMEEHYQKEYERTEGELPEFARRPYFVMIMLVFLVFALSEFKGFMEDPN